jgi:C_GCAxxG_C_C family probable redox protein
MVMTKKYGSKEILLSRIEKTAHDYEKEFHGCSRCVFKALQDHMDIGDNISLKASTLFAAGVAMRSETCGALLGGLMALGIVTSSEKFEDEEALTKSLSAGFRLAKRVEKEFGSTNCAKIQTNKLGKFYNIADTEQYQAFIEAGGYVECPKVAGKIARITGEFIFEYINNQRNE